jgi:lysophospholipase L1-like esterase
VKDLNRGGTFIWSSTGTANGGTVFAGATGFWNRQYSGAINPKWFDMYYTKNILNSLSKKETIKIVCYGDSITYGKSADTGSQASDPYPQTLQLMLRNMFNYSGVTVINNGVSGRQTDTALSRFDTEVVTQAPQYVFIMFGINDARDYDGGTYDVVPISEYRQNLTDMILKSYQNGITPILISPTPTIEINQNVELVSYNQACIDLANELGVEYIDMHYEVSEYLKLQTKEYTQIIMSDSIHFNSYSFISAIVLKNIINYSGQYIDSPRKITALDSMNIVSDTVTNTDVSYVPYFIISNNGTNGTYLKAYFYVAKDGLDLIIRTIEAANTVLSAIVKVDGIPITITGDTDLAIEKDNVLVSNITRGYHTIEINNTDFVDETPTDLLVIGGFEFKDTKELVVKSRILSGVVVPFTMKVTEPILSIAEIKNPSNLIAEGYLTDKVFALSQSALLAIDFKLKVSAYRSGFSWFGNSTPITTTSPTLYRGGYYVYCGDAGALLLLKYIDDVSTYSTLATAIPTITLNTEYRISITHSTTGEIKVYLDDVLVITHTDAQYTSGHIGAISRLIGTVTISNISVGYTHAIA